MPFLAPLVPLIIAGTAAASTGIGLYKASQAPDSGDLMAQQQAFLDKQKAAEEEARQRNAGQAIRQVLPDMQAQVGGSVSPEYYASTAAALTGYGDQSSIAQQLAQQFAGGGAGGLGTTPGLSVGGGSQGLGSQPMFGGNMTPPNGQPQQQGSNGIPQNLLQILEQLGLAPQGGGQFNGGQAG